MKKILIGLLILTSFNLHAQCGFRSDYISWVKYSSKYGEDSLIKKDTLNKGCKRDTPIYNPETKWISPPNKIKKPKK
jgi:hypothetical protein